MRADDLDIRELVQFDEASGVFRFLGQRSLIVDVVALGMLRKQLVETIGLPGARAVLTRFGFVHGWRIGELLKSGFTWDSEQEWGKAIGRIHQLRGEARPGPGEGDLLGTTGITFVDSWEADQHVAHFGRATEPACWAMCGLVSGLVSMAFGATYFVLEDRCVARGDAACRIFARTREGWGAERSRELAYFDDKIADLLDPSLQKVAERLRALPRAQARAGGRVEKVPPEASGMVVRSPPMKAVVELAGRAARVDSTVLVTGESGVGKERIAGLVHALSARAGGPFLAINCGALSESLLESELFGHVRGAFTGAIADRLGLFEAAIGGTLFLDEIGETSPAMQVKLLRALQERVVRRVGDNHDRAVDVRVITATNRDLPDEVARGRFREDLLYRLKVIEIRVPPLRERRDDILPLARAFVAEAGAKLRAPVTGMTTLAADQLLRYAWPGNVRELANAIERAMALTSGTVIDAEDLPEEVRTAIPTFSPAQEIRPLAEIERDYILAALARNHGNQTLTARQLGIGAATLYRKLKQYKASGPS